MRHSRRPIIAGCTALLCGGLVAAAVGPAALTASASPTNTAVTWTPGAAAPAADRTFAASTFLAGTCQLLVQGGTSFSVAGDNPSDSLLYTPATDSWTTLHWNRNAGPGPRRHTTLSYDASEARAVMFGGVPPSGAAANTTWSFNPATKTWTDLTPRPLTATNNPPARYLHGQAYSSVVRRVYVFGGLGADGHTPLGDLWTLSPTTPTTWSRVTPVGGPSPRYGVGMAEDHTTGKFVIYGGTTSTGAHLNDTWLFDPAAATWTQVPTAHTPTQRAFMAMRWSSSVNAVVVAGGLSEAGDTNATWAFDSTANDWVPLAQTGAPSKYESGSLSENTCAGNDILFGQYEGAATPNQPWSLR